MRLRIEICDSLDQVVERREALEVVFPDCNVLYQSSGAAESGDIVRHLVTRGSDGSTDVSRGAKFDTFANKFVLVITH